MKKILSFAIFMLFSKAYGQCNPLEVALYISEKDAWEFPYSTFYWGMSDAVLEIQQNNPPCYNLLEENEQCIQECRYPGPDPDNYQGRIACIYYNCPDGDALLQNYDNYIENPFHVYGQEYCSDETKWDPVLDQCIVECEGDLDQNDTKNITDVIILVNDILAGASCE